MLLKFSFDKSDLCDNNRKMPVDFLVVLLEENKGTWGFAGPLKLFPLTEDINRRANVLVTGELKIRILVGWLREQVVKSEE